MSCNCGKKSITKKVAGKQPKKKLVFPNEGKKKDFSRNVWPLS